MSATLFQIHAMLEPIAVQSSTVVQDRRTTGVPASQASGATRQIAATVSRLYLLTHALTRQKTWENFKGK